jgi:hypothetical protein
MSEPDNPSRRRRPPTIDLTAKEVETEQARPSGSEPASAPKSARWTGGGSIVPLAIAALTGVVVAAAIIAALWAAGIIPPSGAPETQRAE